MPPGRKDEKKQDFLGAQGHAAVASPVHWENDKQAEAGERLATRAAPSRTLTLVRCRTSVGRGCVGSVLLRRQQNETNSLAEIAFEPESGWSSSTK
jgi:hypothetical protein